MLRMWSICSAIQLNSHPVHGAGSEFPGETLLMLKLWLKPFKSMYYLVLVKDDVKANFTIFHARKCPIFSIFHFLGTDRGATATLRVCSKLTKPVENCKILKSLLWILTSQACSQDHFFWGGGGMQDLPKVDFLNLTPLNPPTKTPFFAHFVAKSGPFTRFGGVRCTHLATGLSQPSIQTYSSNLWC